MKKRNPQLEVYLSQRRALIDYATPITGCRSRAEDIVQDAYIKVMPNNLEIFPKDQGGGYLYRVVRNMAIDFVRRSSMESRNQDSSVVGWLEPSGAEDPELIVGQRDQLDKVCRLLEDLPEKDRVAIEMHRLGGYTLHDIAAHLNVSVATVHRMIRKGLVYLSLSLEDENKDL